jgi:protease-4
MPGELPIPRPIADAILQRFSQVSHLEDYFGLWSIHEPIFRSAVERINTIDLAAHVASPEAKAAARQQAEDDYELTPDGVALFQISGPMMKSVSSLSAGTSTVRVRQQLRAGRKNDAVRGALLVMDTPGGTVRGNRDLADEVAAFAEEKPIFCFVDDLCASAGVSIASQATKRFANNPTAQYGAMGTYSVLVDANRAAENAGFTVHVVKAGEFKGLGEMGTKVTEAQLKEVQRVIDASNAEYLAVIARGLGLPLAKIQALADGRIYLAADAVTAGLIDGIQSYEQTYRQLVAAVASKGPAKSKPAKPSTPKVSRLQQGHQYGSRDPVSNSKRNFLSPRPNGARRNSNWARRSRTRPSTMPASWKRKTAKLQKRARHREGRNPQAGQRRTRSAMTR